MRVQSLPPVAARTSDIVDLTEGISDLDEDHESGDEDGNLDKDLKSACLPAKKKKMRKGRPGGKGKKNKIRDKASKLGKLQGEMVDANASDDDADCEASSETLSEACTVSTAPIAEVCQSHKLPKTPEHIKLPNVHIPVLPHYEVRAMPGRNEVDMGTPTEKHGVFATQDIVAGTRIICESPQITLPSPGDQVVELMTAFYALPKDQQDQIWNLNPADSAASPLLTYMGEQIAKKVAMLKHVMAKIEDQRTAEENAFLINDVPKLQEAIKMCRLAARWHAGRHSLIDLPESERCQLPPGTPITGLFVETARLRHSCVPNCYAHFNPSTNLITVHTTKAIAPDEELTLSTIASVYYLSASDRTTELQSKFGITCTCEACDPTHPNFPTHESARLLSYTRAIHLEHFCTLLDMLSSKDVCRDLCLRDSDRPDPPDLEDLRDAENTCLALISDLKDMGCHGPELIRWYNALIDRIQPRAADLLESGERYTWWRFILRHAGECVKIAGRAFGADSIEFAQAGLRKERIEALVGGAEERVKGFEESKRKVGVGRKVVGQERKKMAALEKVARKMNEDGGKKEEWEIVGSVVKKGEEEVMEDKKGDVVATIGKYALVEE